MLVPLSHYGHADPVLTVGATVGLLVVLYVRERIEAAGAWVADRLAQEDGLEVPADHPDPHLYREYVTGDMDESEYEHRLGAALDPYQSRTMDVVATVDGIGPERRLRIAEAAGSVETLAAMEPREVADALPEAVEQHPEALGGGDILQE